MVNCRHDNREIILTKLLEFANIDEYESIYMLKRTCAWLLIVDNGNCVIYPNIALILNIH